jgi:hypothetical protein
VNDWECAVFDLAGIAPATASGASSTFTGVTATQTASGGGYYKCVLTGTGTANDWFISLNDASTTSGINAAYGVKSYTGDGSSSIDIAFASLTTTGATDYNATTTQIHREYAPTLKSVDTAGQPRFEYDPATDGQSVAKGILIEGAATNLLNYSEQFDNAYWSKPTGTTVTSNVAVAPSGELAADLAVADSDGSTITRYVAKVFPFTSGTTYTLSVYAKAAGLTKFALRAGNPATYAAQTIFTLTGDGSVSVSLGSAKIEPCGNGWYRCSVTGTAGASSSTNLLLSLLDSSENYTFDGDGYSGVLLWGAQMETGAASSYLKAEGSTVTRAADSLSVATADIGYTGGDGSLFIDLSLNARTSGMGAFLSSDADNYYMLGQFSATLDYMLYSELNNAVQIAQFESSTAIGAKKLAASWSTNNASSCINGGSVATDTSNALPLITDLHIGSNQAGAAVLNGHVKRVALYNEALSDTNLQALTS